MIAGIFAKATRRIRKARLAAKYGMSSPLDLKKLATGSGHAVSVDLFDTLVYRQMKKPDDIFRIQYNDVVRIMPHIASAEEWVFLRKATERRLTAAARPNEITLESIYAAIASQLELSPEIGAALMESELAREKESIRPYRELAETLRDLAASGTHIIVTTDTYLPESFIRAILADILPFAYTLLCSSTTNKTKRDGTAFALMRETAGTAKLIHIGDNRDADLWQARQNGVESYLIHWDRQRWLDDKATFTDYLRGCGILRFTTPSDGYITDDTTRAAAETAWRWGIVLSDFLLGVRDYAHNIQADEIWMLSRDCETMFKAVGDTEDFFKGIPSRYVYASRACIHPILSEKAPDLFRKWMGKEPTSADAEKGRAATAYFNNLAAPDAKRILIVDMGAKGRLQVSLQMALPDKEIYGYYFGLEPRAEAATLAKSTTFVPWDRTLFTMPPVEWGAGFEGPSCDYFLVQDHVATPVFRKADGDRSPAVYCQYLRAYLTMNLQNARQPLVSASHLRRRAMAVRQQCIFPDIFVKTAFSQDSIASETEGGANTVQNGGGASFLNRIIGREVAGNIWPPFAMWSVSPNPYTVNTLQYFLYMRTRCKETVKRMLKKLR